jgi:ERI1 exoribonuclease 3
MEKTKLQPFDYYIVLDLEGLPEIVELPAILIDSRTLETISIFHRYVYPTNVPKSALIPGIKDFYGPKGVEEIWWKEASLWSDVFPNFLKWISDHTIGKTFSFVTCGNWDIEKQIPKQCSISEITLPEIFNQWINIKDVYLNFFTWKPKPKGMLSMLTGLNIDLDGHHHLGIDDTKNITKILKRLIEEGAILDITAKRNADGTIKYLFENRIKPRQHKKN